MIFDMEGHKLTLSERLNAHLLILGRSGSGKTFFSCRKIEEDLEKGKKVAVFDYSSSYTLEELNRNGFRYLENAQLLDPLVQDLHWECRGRNVKGSLTDALLRCLNIRSYYQKRLLREAVAMTFEDAGAFTMRTLTEKLEELLDVKTDADSRKNLGHLLTRVEPYGATSCICIKESEVEPPKDRDAPLKIIQLSGFSELQRKFFVKLLSELFWADVRSGKKSADVALFDEFQNVEIDRGGALSNMLREGRKFGLAAYLSTQFLGNYDRESVETLMQAANMLFFQPAANDMKSIAWIIDPQNADRWQKTLGELDVGEAVLKGQYHLGGREKEIRAPILCEIREERLLPDDVRKILENY